MNKSICFYFFNACVFLVAISLLNAHSAPTPLGNTDFGVYTNGMLFYNGEYIPPPYSVVRKEDSLYVNSLLILQVPLRAPPSPEPPPKIPSTDPPIPKEITEETEPFDAILEAYLRDKRLFLFAKHGEEKGIDMMVDAYKALPCVLNAKRNDEDTLRLWWKGQYLGTGSFLIYQRNEPGRNNDIAKYLSIPENVIAEIESSARRIVRVVRDGDYLMLGVPWRQGGAGALQKALFPLAMALQKAQNETEFIAIMQTNMPPGEIEEQGLKNFWKHREQAFVWEARAKRLYAEYLEEHLSDRDGLDALDFFIRAAPSEDALIATLQAKRPRLLRRILGNNSEGNPIYSKGLFYEKDLREFFKNRNNPEGWRPIPPPPYKPPSEIIETISAALEKAETETEFRAALDGKFTDTDWRGGAATWDKYFTFIWERRNRPRHEWSGEPSSPPVTYTNAPSQGPDFDW